MTRLDARTLGRLAEPLPVTTFPYVDTIDIEDATFDPADPSPCVPTAVSVWYALDPPETGRLVLDLAGSTPLDPLVRIYRRTDTHPLVFLGCASPVWNAQLSLDVPVGEGEAILAQVGTSESREGRLVVRAELHAH
jgi:hypothetical protein